MTKFEKVLKERDFNNVFCIYLDAEDQVNNRQIFAFEGEKLEEMLGAIEVAKARIMKQVEEKDTLHFLQALISKIEAKNATKQ